MIHTYAKLPNLLALLLILKPSAGLKVDLLPHILKKREIRFILRIHLTGIFFLRKNPSNVRIYPSNGSNG
ncbi:hypothetical protein RIR_jg29476.t1 [Rhizophagus irregularis DAOM 181602=DAOM 197198]|nr:hypothetical protein RIR_jg29476.t1 [Rhizophagus irregularis DAOM 181602=DAOM 197198]